jgi:hypothetical protein
VGTIYTNPGPSCDLYISPSSILEGEDAELRWNSSNVHQAYLNQDIGYVGSSGSRNIAPRGPGTYTYQGTFYGDNGNTITCSATLRVRERSQHIVFDQLPIVTSQTLTALPLTALPYTGLDLGPVGTAVYWLAIILWSLALAYVIMGGVVPFALKAVGLAPHAAPAHGAVMTHAPAVHAPPAHTPAPVVHSVAAPARSSSYEGFKAMAQGSTLTVDDIVKGLSRTGDDSHLLPAAPAVHAPVVEAPVVVAPVAAAPVEGTVPTFIAALLAGKKEEVFTIIREVNKAGHDAEAFIQQTVMALDDAYRAKTEGASVHPEVRAAVGTAEPIFLEKLITALSTAVDSSYSAGTTAVKLAVTRALNLIEG